MTNMAYMCKNRHGMYYARFIIPKPLQPHFKNKKEIRRSLQTDSRKLAIKRARIYRVEFESIVEKLMSKADNTSERAKQIINSLFAEKPKATELIPTNKPDKPTNIDSDKTQLITYVDLSGITVTIDTGNDEQDAKTFKQIAPTPSDEQLARQERRDEELHQAQLAHLAAITAAPTVSAPAKPINPKKLSEYLVDYIKYKTNSATKQRWNSPDTIEQSVNFYEQFCKDANDIPAAAFDWDEARRYIKLAHLIPPYFTNKKHIEKKFVGITAEMILDDGIDTSMFEVRKPSTICNDLKRVHPFLDWMIVEERVIELQEAANKFKSAIRNIDPKSKRRNFSPPELKILFEGNNSSPENYVNGFNSKRGVDANLKYWLPLLGLYTGATIAELCQLHLSDIRLHQGFDGSEHWVIDINSDAEKCAMDEDVRLKNQSGRPRLIPIHNALISLNFTDYVQALKDKNEVELFPLSKRNENEYGKGSFGAESQWFGEYSSAAGVTDSDVVFHSFRHNLTTELSRNNTPNNIIAAIIGHSKQTTAEKYYNSSGHRDGDISPLVEAINKVNYGLAHHPFKEMETLKRPKRTTTHY